VAVGDRRDTLADGRGGQPVIGQEAEVQDDDGGMSR
jgi:hypothetical protein